MMIVVIIFFLSKVETFIWITQTLNVVIETLLNKFDIVNIAVFDGKKHMPPQNNWSEKLFGPPFIMNSKNCLPPLKFFGKTHLPP